MSEKHILANLSTYGVTLHCFEIMRPRIEPWYLLNLLEEGPPSRINIAARTIPVFVLIESFGLIFYPTGADSAHHEQDRPMVCIPFVKLVLVVLHEGWTMKNRKHRPRMLEIKILDHVK